MSREELRETRTMKNPPAGHGPYYRVYKRNPADHQPASPEPMEMPGALKVGHVPRDQEHRLADEFGEDFDRLTPIAPSQWTAQKSRREQTQRGGRRK